MISKIDNRIKEQDDRRNRSLNLMICNLPESIEESAMKRN